MSVMTIGDLAVFYAEKSRPVGLVISNTVVLMQAIRAARYYDGFGQIESILERNQDITAETLLTKGEISVITPLFELYVERENALLLEASRALGVEVYGRTISEISSDITQKELEIQNLAFEFDFITI